MRGSTSTIRNREEASTSCTMDQNMWVSLKMVILMVWVGFTVQMVISTRDSIRMIRGTGREDFAFRTACRSS